MATYQPLTAPQYAQPGTNQYANYSDFFKNNKWNDPYGSLVGNDTDLGNSLIKRRLAYDPFSGGAGSAATQFGLSSGVNPNDPNIPAWMANLEGGQKNLLDDATKRFASAGVASSRGGMGVAGGVAPEAGARADAMKQLASGYADRYGQAVDWTFKNNATANQNASAMADLYGKLYSTDMSTGQGLLGQAMTGTQAADASRTNWTKMMEDAFNKDTDWAHGATDRANAEQDRERKQIKDQYTSDQDAQLQHLLQYSIMEGPGRTMTYPQTNIQEYLRQKGLIKGGAGSGGGSGRKSGKGYGGGYYNPDTGSSSREMALQDPEWWARQQSPGYFGGA